MGLFLTNSSLMVIWITSNNTIIENVYPSLLKNFSAQWNNYHFSRLWWEQASAPLHHADHVTEHLQEIFQRHVISCNVDEWHTRSPDLTPCDFFQWFTWRGKYFQLHLLFLVFWDNELLLSLKQDQYETCCSLYFKGWSACGRANLTFLHNLVV